MIEIAIHEQIYKAMISIKNDALQELKWWDLLSRKVSKHRDNAQTGAVTLILDLSI